VTDTLTTADYPDELIEINLHETPREQLVDWLETMILIREFEGSLEPLTLNGKIPGSVHQAVGQEAAAVGAIRALKPGDIVASGHRGHHHALALGLAPRSVMAELFGRATGCAGGRGGTMHLADFTINYFGGNGIVGAGLGLAMGGALAASLRGTDQIALGFFGDGGANTGRTWEAVNMAAVWKLPLIAFCENNLYAVETSIGRAAASGSIAERAAGFGLPAVQVDGQDVCAVYREVQAARRRAEAGDGPTFIEALTYRYHGHNTGEVTTYRTDDEVEQWRRSRDPVQRLRRALEEEGLLPEGQAARIQAEAGERVQDAIEFADASPWPDTATASDNVFGSDIASVIRS
jgi:TPP-dependent pyruvate/acetoin dehydrogenase alpha subunit